MFRMMTLALDWRGGMQFASVGPGPSLQLASSDPAIVSPPQALAYAVMGCMGMDVVHILEKARHTLASLTVHIEAERAADHPRRFVAMRIRFDLATDAPRDAVERAIEMSRSRYCSVLQTLRPDIELTTTCTISPAS
jgi:putative redox protein